ncbi:TPA: 30S ribosomal protein S21 [Candidatus Collierbacteria bacterium]|uniref:Small ribosomal subunit protein bS21 n=1 Tax=Candidatus Collierbacteria bacterium RIFOXYD1_FULL_46_26 TaxID=1817732 RepID=A0A1F5FXA2_9BACT|nr:MAG: 30S ribosomal protein S21 [Microgenomates group bacterium GW2011_GWF1_46_12]KKU27574.1 MAG: 30S ribosomal protein S21 [Microgenomates group bacterium GW2011_GWF2_46_18]KKU43614.1 MAG: 30S ribosomal protein S21 [Microgenomates group bacterium GW2011_GWA1_46_7]KKU44688.1 MAG: 30S ribosomal protein S21 [Microgenomates group bacterium GW2011_GWB1_46_7]KKU60264.1 MAG: 30S ribosomal protein S21 [Microgenomates group bacterium GW2011_GWE1_47_12]KKU62418.1 MAG: 30S ribosomal protein S21 [Micro
MPIIVRAKKDESPDAIIRRFKKKVLNENIIEEVREREFHKSPAVKRKERNNEIKRKRYTERMQKLAANRKKS